MLPLSLLAAVGALVTAVLVLVPVARAAGTLFVSPSGSDANSGATAAQALKTIQIALDKAGPGTTVQLAAGTYMQDAVTKSNGVTVTGPTGAVVNGAGNGRVFEINHDDTTLKGFTIDGKAVSGESGVRDKLIFVIGTEAGDGVSGTRIQGMKIANAGGECIRLKYLATNSEISGNTIGPCGIEDFQDRGGGKNGEGVYIGTAPEQLDRNPDGRADVSRDNQIFDNVFNTQGNECVDIKEGSTANIVRNNDCTGQKDPESAGMNSRGSGNTFTANVIHNNVGAGIRFGGDTSADGENNIAVNNLLSDNESGAFKIRATPQDMICGNQITGDAGEAPGSATAGCGAGVEAFGTPGPNDGSAGSGGQGTAGLVELRLNPKRTEAPPQAGLLRLIDMLEQLLNEMLPRIGSVQAQES